MIPSRQMIFVFGCVLAPLVFLSTFHPSGQWILPVSFFLIVMVVSLDGFLGRLDLKDYTITFSEVTRLSRDHEGLCEMLIHSRGGRLHELRVGVPFPNEVGALVSDQMVHLADGVENSRIFWKCKPTRRGSYLLHEAYLESLSPMRFWQMRRKVAAKAEIRVYPDLFKERRFVSALLLNRKSLGMHAQRQVGKGRDFEKLRDYVHGDSLDEIHWKATAKRGHLVTKVFQIERTQEVYLIVDASRLSSKTGSAVQGSAQNDSMLERYLSSALILALAAEQHGDLFGIATFSDKVEKFVRAKSGREHYSICRDAIYELMPRMVAPDFEEVCSFLRVKLRKRALLLFLTSLEDPLLSEQFTKSIQLLSRQHFVVVAMPRPGSAAPLFADDSVHTVEEIYDRLGGHLEWHQLKEIERILKTCGVRFFLVDHEKMTLELVSEYINIKQRQVL